MIDATIWLNRVDKVELSENHNIMNLHQEGVGGSDVTFHVHYDKKLEHEVKDTIQEMIDALEQMKGRAQYNAI